MKLQELAERHPGVTQAIGECYTEAASVCFQRHHDSPRQIQISDGDTSQTRTVSWQRPDQRTSMAWQNDIDATEAGAYGVSLAAVEAQRGLVAICRAHNLTGADYYIAPIGSPPDDLENSIRLEVSGIDNGSDAQIKNRMKEKIEQTKNGKSDLPAIASVVAFKQLSVNISEILQK